ncbi:MAG TPA: M14 family metallopeptidase [Symbiobacteriaceae bacterium]|jgi:murein tripeptide amidase MpaA
MEKTAALAVLKGYDSSKYYRYDDLSRFLKALAAAYPALCRLESIGKSPEGRDLWSVTLTNFATGADDAKPAYHINGQHHAGEVTASAVALYFVHDALTNYGQAPAVTELLDTRAVYVLPRMAVDGAEWYFAHPQMLRSSPLRYPLEEEPEGLRPEDVDGDGRILQMRIPHPLGEWKISAKDPRLMVRRRPEDREGTFYRIYTEGLNYPTNSKPQHRQGGSGRYPFDRPEVRAMAEFWLAHPNIGAAISYRTRAGLNLRPSPLVADDKLNGADLQMYKQIGETCTRLTGYPTVSVYDYFTMDYAPDKLAVGSWLEWAYDKRGVQAFETELWDFRYICGVKKRPLKDLKNLTTDQQEEDALLQLRWNDRELGGAGFSNWKEFDHPQLGRVEIGGWEPKFCGQNPPEKLLHAECHRNALFAIEHALATPRLAIGEVRIKPIGGDCYHIAVQVLNRGYLPTNVTQVAIAMKATRPVEVSISGARVVGGKAKQDLGHIAGRGSGALAVWAGAVSPSTEKWAEWVVQGESGTFVTISAGHDRGGSASRTVVLS